jgi:hypothetical protein
MIDWGRPLLLPGANTSASQRPSTSRSQYALECRLVGRFDGYLADADSAYELRVPLMVKVQFMMNLLCQQRVYCGLTYKVES